MKTYAICNPNRSLDRSGGVLRMLFDAFCVFPASFAHHFADIARYAAQNDEPNLLENPSKIMSNSNDRIGFNDGLGFDQDNIISEWNADLEAVICSRV
ncbi:MAG: hypothetical protein HUJ93_06380 [Bacteroidales bacterium]|nr:hypothetical protein [Bacteroidales bacterium]